MDARLIGSVTVPWITVPHTVDLLLGAGVPDGHEVSGAFVLVLDADRRLLLTRLTRPGRGWEVPGGHLEPGESPAEAAARELAEETGVFVPAARLSPFGGQRIALHERPPATHRYPQHTYLAFFALRPTVRAWPTRPAAGSEAAEAGWFSAAEVRERCAGAAWLVLLEALLSGKLSA